MARAVRSSLLRGHWEDSYLIITPNGQLQVQEGEIINFDQWTSCLRAQKAPFGSHAPPHGVDSPFSLLTVCVRSLEFHRQDGVE
jgi:hypothetical protein